MFKENPIGTPRKEGSDILAAKEFNITCSPTVSAKKIAHYYSSTQYIKCSILCQPKLDISFQVVYADLIIKTPWPY